MMRLPEMNPKHVRLMGIITLFGVFIFSVVGATSHASDRRQALKSGAWQLSSDEIANLIVGKSVTVKSGEKKFVFHYGKDNVLSGKMIGGKWSDTGYYGITDDDKVCLSITKDHGRLRCVTLLRVNGVIKKFDVRGKMTFELLKIDEGKSF